MGREMAVDSRVPEVLRVGGYPVRVHDLQYPGRFTVKRCLPGPGDLV